MPDEAEYALTFIREACRRLSHQQRRTGVRLIIQSKNQESPEGARKNQDPKRKDQRGMGPIQTKKREHGRRARGLNPKESKQVWIRTTVFCPRKGRKELLTLALLGPRKKIEK